MQSGSKSSLVETSPLDTFSDDLVAVIPQIRAFARSMCGDQATADDIAQEAVAKAWAARASFAPGTNFRAWMYRITRNCFYTLKRRDWRSVPLDMDTAERSLVTHEAPNGNIELNEMRRALSMLTPGQREALILVGAGGVSYEETAEILQVTLGTVKSRVSRGRDALLALLENGDLVDAPFEDDCLGRIMDDLREGIPDAPAEKAATVPDLSPLPS